MDVELLISNNRWLRHLARRLLRDEASVDDVLQQTWVAALERPPAQPHAMRAWLGSVVRRLAARHHRDAARRRCREEAVAAPDKLPDTADLLARAELQRRVSAAVLELDEPYRSTVLLRFYEDLSSEEIARRQQLPAATVRTRLKRGLDMLRARLDQSYGDRRQWSLLLVPFARLGSQAAVTSSAAATLPLSIAGALVMTFKVALGVGALATLAGVLWFLSTDERELPTQEEATPLGADSPQDSPRAEPSIAELPREADSAQVETEVTEKPEAPSVEPVKEEVREPTIRGTLVRVDDSGQRFFGEDGEFRLQAKGATSRDEAPIITVESGEWSFFGPVEGAFVPADLRIAGEPAYPTADEYRVSPEGTLEVEARWLPTCFLRVVDAATGQDLDEIEILRDVGWWRYRVHPGDYDPEDVYRKRARSPIELPVIDGVRDYWIRAPGYAWGHARIDHRAGGTQTVALRRSCELVVTLDNLDPDSGTVIRLVASDHTGRGGTMAEVSPTPGAPVVFSSLLPGEYEIRAEIGMWYDPPTRLGTATAKVSPGERVEVHLELEVLPDLGGTVPFAGTIQLAESEVDIDLNLDLQPANRPPDRERVHIASGEIVPAEDDPRRLHWRAEVLPGRWLVKVNPLQIGETFEVGPNGREDVSISVPELAVVIAEVVDHDTGESVETDNIAWTRGMPDIPGAWTLETVRRQDLGRPFRFVVPVGTISVMAHSDGYEPADQNVTIRRGENELTLELEPLPGIILTLRCDGTVVPFSWDMPVEVERVDGEGNGRVKRTDGPRAIIDVGSPGTYRLEIGPLEGYAPIPARQVPLSRGERAEIEIELFRER